MALLDDVRALLEATPLEPGDYVILRHSGRRCGIWRIVTTPRTEAAALEQYARHAEGLRQGTLVLCHAGNIFAVATSSLPVVTSVQKRVAPRFVHDSFFGLDVTSSVS